MLRKLFKYEINATARILLPLYIVLMVYSLIYKLISSSTPDRWQTPEVISFILYIMILVGIMVMTLILIIQRFYKNLLTDEGYLMFTLPTKPWNHIVCKLLISMMWTALSGIVAILSILVITYERVFTAENLQYFTEFVREIGEYINFSSVAFLLEFLIIVIIALACNILIVYASISLGHLFSKHKILASLGAFIILSTISQILFSIIGWIGSRIPLFQFDMHSNFIIPPILHAIMWISIVFLALLGAGYFFITNYILSKRLNLE